MKKIIISSDFSNTPGGRWKRLGPNSGEEFYENLLYSNFKAAMDDDDSLYIDLDGVIGYPSSFLDQSFGELSREFGAKEVLKRINFKSEDEPSLPQDIVKKIKDADNCYED
ncbi:MAG: STAS-like domain-containing protein [Erysipelotrichaceae bacterium]|nr:STAS-like domain-containing protein [Erysipelotrichaceae bacterium]